MFAVISDHEIKIVVRHPKTPISPGRQHRAESGFPLGELARLTLNCRKVLHFRSPAINRCRLVDSVDNFEQRLGPSVAAGFRLHSQGLELGMRSHRESDQPGRGDDAHCQNKHASAVLAVPGHSAFINRAEFPIENLT